MVTVMYDQYHQLVDSAIQSAQVIRSVNPGIPFPLAMIMALDNASVDRHSPRFDAGELEFELACYLIGPSARIRWAVNQYFSGAVEKKLFYEVLPRLWLRSNPDPTDLHTLRAWRQAWIANRRKTICDKDELSNRRGVLIAYQGQPAYVQRPGIQWTLSSDVAEQIANPSKSSLPGKITMGMLDVKHVIAYLTKDGRNIVIADPANVRIIPYRTGKPVVVTL